MGSMKDAFGDTPFEPEPTSVRTRREANRRVDSKRSTLKSRALEALRKAGDAGMTPDEIATEIGSTPFAIRPRLTELKQEGLVVENKMMRPNVSNVPAAVLVAK